MRKSVAELLDDLERNQEDQRRLDTRQRELASLPTTSLPEATPEASEDVRPDPQGSTLVSNEQDAAVPEQQTPTQSASQPNTQAPTNQPIDNSVDDGFNFVSVQTNIPNAQIPTNQPIDNSVDDGFNFVSVQTNIPTQPPSQQTSQPVSQTAVTPNEPSDTQSASQAPAEDSRPSGGVDFEVADILEDSPRLRKFVNEDGSFKFNDVNLLDSTLGTVGAFTDGASGFTVSDFDDELAGTLNSGFGVLGDRDKAIRKERLRQELNKQFAPISHAAGQIAAGVLTIPKAITQLGFKGSVAAGAVDGAIRGAGNDTGSAGDRILSTDRLSDAALGGLFGAGGSLAGEVIQPAVTTGARIGRSLTGRGASNQVDGTLEVAEQFFKDNPSLNPDNLPADQAFRALQAQGEVGDSLLQSAGRALGSQEKSAEAVVRSAEGRAGATQTLRDAADNTLTPQAVSQANEEVLNNVDNVGAFIEGNEAIATSAGRATQDAASQIPVGFEEIKGLQSTSGITLPKIKSALRTAVSDRNLPTTDGRRVTELLDDGFKLQVFTNETRALKAAGLKKGDSVTPVFLTKGSGKNKKIAEVSVDGETLRLLRNDLSDSAAGRFVPEGGTQSVAVAAAQSEGSESVAGLLSSLSPEFAEAASRVANVKTRDEFFKASSSLFKSTDASKIKDFNIAAERISKRGETAGSLGATNTVSQSDIFTSGKIGIANHFSSIGKLNSGDSSKLLSGIADLSSDKNFLKSAETILKQGGEAGELEFKRLKDSISDITDAKKAIDKLSKAKGNESTFKNAVTASIGAIRRTTFLAGYIPSAKRLLGRFGVDIVSANNNAVLKLLTDFSDGEIDRFVKGYVSENPEEFLQGLELALSRKDSQTVFKNFISSRVRTLGNEFTAQTRGDSNLASDLGAQ